MLAFWAIDFTTIILFDPYNPKEIIMCCKWKFESVYILQKLLQKKMGNNDLDTLVVWFQCKKWLGEIPSFLIDKIKWFYSLYEYIKIFAEHAKKICWWVNSCLNLYESDPTISIWNWFWGGLDERGWFRNLNKRKLILALVQELQKDMKYRGPKRGWLC